VPATDGSDELPPAMKRSPPPQKLLVTWHIVQAVGCIIISLMEPCKCAVELYQRAHVDSVIHCLLVIAIAIAELPYDVPRSHFVQTSTT